MTDMHEEIKQAISDGVDHARSLNTGRTEMVTSADPLAHAAGSVERLIKEKFKESPEAFARWAAS